MTETNFTDLRAKLRALSDQFAQASRAPMLQRSGEMMKAAESLLGFLEVLIDEMEKVCQTKD